ncbi:autophagy-related protein 9 [Ananas comosus]|uniref:Autophagy-related protein 9 n=1 Tax=Ananas comosus TaxID=4615 RepID=A0A199VFJ2_ANACO|nr:autophagy-related protein 9 [Ananas comosus]OAY75874.1 Autophagy-related protein 9 [Ananas comosus]
MSSSHKGALFAPLKFKWPWRTESPLNTQLLIDIPPEIELSDYRKLPSSGSESPSSLLNGEGLKAKPITDLDVFFERLYDYYCEKGLWCIIVKWIVEILCVIFMVCFIGFFLLVLDWNALRHAKCGIDAVEAGEKPCDLAKFIKKQPLVPFTFPKMVIVGCMVILTLYGFLNFLKFFVQLQNTVQIRRFYHNCLHVTDREIQMTAWPKILEKVVRLQRSQQLCVVKDLSEHDVVMRIMRKENYLIGMLNKGILSFPISWWVPGAGPAVNSRINGRKNHLILPKTLEWTLNWCIFQSMFDRKFCVRKDFLTNPSLLRNRLVFLGVGMLLISPCLVIFMLVYLFLSYAEQFYNHPSTASSRRWSNLSKWILREFNEVNHLFKHRLNNSAVHASNYLKQFPSPLISIIAKFISFVSGGFAAILIIVAVLDESLLEGHIFGRNLFWYAAVFGTVTAISRAAVSNELQVLDAEGAMTLVVQQTHYMPKRWRGKENTDLVRREFETLFQYTGMMLLEEMASILITPYLLIFVVPKRVDDILRFVSDFTIYVEGVGDVCSLSLFDFERHGNRNYASPFGAVKYMRSSQGKMEKSFLSFQSTYPSWEPSEHGRRFLFNLQKFKEQKMRHTSNQEYSTSQIHRLSSTIRSHGDNLIHRFPSRSMRPPDNFDSLLSVNLDQRAQPYLLDWYYTSPPANADNSEESPSPPNEAAIRNKALSEIEEEDDSWAPRFSDRVQSHLEASTSNSFLRNEAYHHHNLEQHAFNKWWDRTVPQSSDPQTSFLEPPVFNHHSIPNHNFSHHSDDVSYRSMEEQEENDGGGRGGGSEGEWPNSNSLSRTRYIEDSDQEEEFGLHFADTPERNEGSSGRVSDIYGGPLVSLPVRIIPRSNDPV